MKTIKIIMLLWLFGTFGHKAAAQSCNPFIAVPSVACMGDATTFGISDFCGCVGTNPKWFVTDPLGGTTSLTGASVGYTFSLTGAYVVCVTWSDVCKHESRSQCDTVQVSNCCKCDMTVDGQSFVTRCQDGYINGAISLNAGSKNVTAVELSLTYFNFSTVWNYSDLFSC